MLPLLSKPIENLKNRDYHFPGLLLVCLQAGYIIITYLFPYIGPDASYYLKIAFDISNGTSYFNDMNVAYTPMSMYLFSILFHIFPNAGFYLINSYFLLFYLVNVLLFYKILGFFNLKKSIKQLFVIVFMLSFYILQGTNIYIEPIVLMFQFSALFLLFKWGKNNNWFVLFLSGVGCFFAFFTKQYGLFIIPSFVFFIFIKSKSSIDIIKHLVYFILGMALPLIAFFIYANLNSEISFNTFLYRISGIKYLLKQDLVTGINYSFYKFIETLMNFILKSPFVLLIIYAVFKKGKAIFTQMSVFYILVISGGSAQLFFASYFHYYQLIFPYCLLLIVSIYHEQQQDFKLKLPRAIKVATMVFVITTSIWFIFDAVYQYAHWKEQKVNKSLLLKIIPENSKVYLQGVSPANYFVCKYNSPDYKKLGYRFPEELSLETINKSLPAGSYVILKPGAYETGIFNDGYRIIHKVKMYKGKECIILLKE